MGEYKLSLLDVERGLYELIEAREEAQDEAARAVVDRAITEYVQREVEKADKIRACLRHCAGGGEGVTSHPHGEGAL